MRPILAAGLCLALLLAAQAAPAKKPAKAPEPQGEPVEISGRIVPGLDKVFIKDAEGYWLVLGVDLTPYAGRQVQARGLLLRRDPEYRTVRLQHYRVVSPDDDSPGAGGEVRPEPPRRRK